MHTARAIFVVIFGILLVGCDTVFEVPMRDYCDKEVAYRLWKRDNSYHLDLEVGPGGNGACHTSLYPPRQLNLSQDVSSPEEADKLIEKYRLEYVAKVPASKPAARVGELPKLPAKVHATCPRLERCVTPQAK